jgi:hypothetical protein
VGGAKRKFHMVNNLVYSADGPSVITVVAEGRVFVKGHRRMLVNMCRPADRVQELGEVLLTRTGHATSSAGGPS